MSEENAALNPVAVPEQDRKESMLAEEVIDVGEHLRRVREARGISVGDAAAALKLSPHQVVALETNDWFQWPRTVTRGFVRNYARHLGLDTVPLMEVLDHAPMLQGPDLAMSTDSSFNMPRERQRDRRDYVRVLAGLIVLAAAFLACFFVPAETWQTTIDAIRTFVSGKETAPESVIELLDASGALSDGVISDGVISGGVISGGIEAAPEALSAAPAPLPDTASASGTPPPDAAPVPAVSEAAVPVADAPGATPSAPSPAGAVIAFSFAESSWVEVRDRDGRIVLSQINPAGSQREVAGQPPFTLVVGNAPHVSLQYKGKPVDLSPRSKDGVARLTLE